MIIHTRPYQTLSNFDTSSTVILSIVKRHTNFEGVGFGVWIHEIIFRKVFPKPFDSFSINENKTWWSTGHYGIGCLNCKGLSTGNTFWCASQDKSIYKLVKFNNWYNPESHLNSTLSKKEFPEKNILRRLVFWPTIFTSHQNPSLYK